MGWFVAWVLGFSLITWVVEIIMRKQLGLSKMASRYSNKTHRFVDVSLRVIFIVSALVLFMRGWLQEDHFVVVFIAVGAIIILLDLVHAAMEWKYAAEKKRGYVNLTTTGIEMIYFLGLFLLYQHVM